MLFTYVRHELTHLHKTRKYIKNGRGCHGGARAYPNPSFWDGHAHLGSRSAHMAFIQASEERSAWIPASYHPIYPVYLYLW